MSKADLFWQYAKEAVLFAANAESDDERQTLFYVPRIWTQAALLERASPNDRDSQADTIAA